LAESNQDGSLLQVMKYNFDKYIDRKGTDSVKYDLNQYLFGKEDVLPMWVADMDFEVPDFIREAIMERASHPVYGYTFRSPRFFEVAAEWQQKRHGWDISPETFSFSPGIVPALNLLVLEFTEPGDSVVVQPPVYFPFFTAVTSHKRKLVRNQLKEQGGSYSMDLEQLEQQFKEGAKMLILCHPHNPVGRVWKKKELESLAELCVRYGVYVISDEIHSDLLLFGNRHIPFASLGGEVAARTFTCVAPSKTFNLAGLHTSVVITTDAKLRKRYEKILDAVHVGGGNLFGQVAFQAAYEKGEPWLKELISYLEENYTCLAGFVEREIPGAVLTPLEATYLAWLDFSFMGLDKEQLKKFIIEEAGLGLNDGPMFGHGGEHHQRINIATPRKVLEEGLGQLAQAVRSRYL